MLATLSANGGLTRASKFLVTITVPAISMDMAADLQFYCDSAQLPGIAMQTDEIRVAGYGNLEKRPYASIFQDVPCTFMNDTDGRVLKFFHKWVQLVYNFNDSSSMDAETAAGIPTNTFAYPKDYYGTVSIAHYDEKANEVITYTLYEAYPISVGDVQVDWSQSDTLLKIPVTFTYKWWAAETLDPGVISERSATRAESLTSTQGRIDSNLENIRLVVGSNSPADIQATTNYLALVGLVKPFFS